MRRYIIGLLIFPFYGLLGQSTGSFTVVGTILDKQGSPISFATVKLGTLPTGAISKADGQYELNNVPKGTHDVIVSFFGYSTETQTVSSNGELIRLNFSLAEDVQTLEEVVVSAETEKAILEHSAKSILVVETKDAKLQAADLGEVMAQTQGVSVRRNGGLGSGTSFSLNGLTGEQIRFFLDGIPLEYNGYTFGISNVPVNLVENIEIYKGVVPIQFGSDALGGAVNIVSPKMHSGSSGSASYQTGSFGTHRVALDLKHLNENTGLFVRAGGFFDYAKNNYKVDVEVPDEKGKLSEVTVPRFHDQYRAEGINVTLGVKDKPWAKELSAKVFYTHFSKEIQNNNLMTGIPYGDVLALRESIGANLVYRKDIGEKVSLDIVSGYNYTERQFIDTSSCVYDWYGKCILIKNKSGEISSQEGPSHESTWNKNIYSRVQASWKISKQHILRLSIAPTYTYRTGDEKFLEVYDPLNARGKSFTWVNGIEHEFNAFQDKLENILFLKEYVQNVSSEEDIPNETPLLTKRAVHHYGIGNGLRYELTDRITTKVSYEYATRLPKPDELFGDGQFTLNNLDLEPERSHNINAKLAFNNLGSSKSVWGVQVNTFLRKIDNLILLIPSVDRTGMYDNVFEAISTGAELDSKWNSKDDRLNITFNTTYQYFYNSSKDGFFETFYGDKIPNRPYFFANGSARYSFKNISKTNDRLSLFWNIRYVHEFYRSWESAGIQEFKLVIPDQQIHNLGVTYKVMRNRTNWALTVESQNLMNAKTFDFYGVQKPGRALYAKITMQF